jgi:hypothetical protein
MTLNLTWDSIIFAAAVLGAVAVILKWVYGGINFMKKPAENEHSIEELSKHHEADMSEMREELRILTYGILACLKGQKEQGCNGPVTEAIDKIEKHLNKKAHE